VNLSSRLTLFVIISFLCVARTDADDLSDLLRELDTTVLTDDEREIYDRMIARDIERRRLLAIRRENKAWSQVDSRDDWEQFRGPRIDALRESLGQFPPVPKDLHVQTTGAIEGDGYRIENLVFESRPGLFVTANLYLPAEPKQSMPAILLCHSHHAPSTQGELQDMGMTWARQGCAVLVPEHLGHGERRQHPFVSSSDYPESFRVSRQDYYFRYNNGLQLQLVGESLMGWMAWDLMRGVDLLCARDDVDRDRIILIGAVAGGGDPAGVTAALDDRIDAVAPFNFGGPQPDYKIPERAEEEFYYFGVPHWEMTRSLRLGGRDGFAHWVIVGSVAPRRLIYSFEFGWDREPDPVWPRLVKVFGLYDARDHLAVATGRGNLKGRPPESTHCTNVGPYHRSQYYPHLERWFGMKPPQEFQQRRETEELLCLTPEVKGKLTPLHELASELGVERMERARTHRQNLRREEQRQKLRDGWSQLLGNIEPVGVPKIVREPMKIIDDLAIKHVLLEVEEGIIVPMVLLGSNTNKSADAPGVILVARRGKQELLRERADQISKLIDAGAIVCLPDLRGTGETRAGNDLGRSSYATSLSCRDQVLGQTLLGSRLRDLRSVVRFASSRSTGPIVVWGESLAETNPAERSEIVPYGVDNPNVHAEPSGGLLALLCGLYEDDVDVVCARGTFASFGSLLNSPFLYVPHDAVVPGAMTVSDVSDIAAAMAPRPLMFANPIDGLNRAVSAEKTQASLSTTTDNYRNADAGERLSLSADRKTDPVEWILQQLDK
jgi:hypothetical protein